MLTTYLIILGFGFAGLIVLQLCARIKRPSYGKVKGDNTPHLHDAIEAAKKEKAQKNPRDSFREQPDTMLGKIKKIVKKNQPVDDPISLREDPRTLTAKVSGLKPLTEQAMESEAAAAKNIQKLEMLISEKNTLIENLKQQLQHEQSHRHTFDQVKETLTNELEEARARHKEYKQEIERLKKRTHELEATIKAASQPVDVISAEDVIEKEGEPKNSNVDDDIIPLSKTNILSESVDEKSSSDTIYSLNDQGSEPTLHDVFSLPETPSNKNKDELDLKDSMKTFEDSLLSDVEKDLNKLDDKKK